MGLNAEAAKKSAEDLKAARAKMEKDNLAQMEALAKEHPEPTIETLQRAMGVPVRKQETKTKTSEPAPAADTAGYTTRPSTSVKPTPPHLVRDEKEVDKK